MSYLSWKQKWVKISLSQFSYRLLSCVSFFAILFQHWFCACCVYASTNIFIHPSCDLRVQIPWWSLHEHINPKLRYSTHIDSQSDWQSLSAFPKKHQKYLCGKHVYWIHFVLVTIYIIFNWGALRVLTLSFHLLHEECLSSLT